MENDFAIGDRVSWRGVNRTETGEIKAIDSENTLILLASGKAIVAELSSLRKTTDGD